MKRAFILLLLVATFLPVASQTVENIRVEQEGENLLIHYRIGGSTSEQLYDVKLTCSIDNGPVFEPRSVIGDVGRNIRGGKSYNTVVWDVFEDVSEVGSVEFFVEVVLVKDESQARPLTQAQQEPMKVSNQPTMINQKPVVVNQNKPPEDDKGFMLSYSGGIYQPVGIMLGRLSNFGLYVAARGGYDLLSGDVLGSVTGGFTLRLAPGEKFDLYGYSGLGAVNYSSTYYGQDFTYFQGEAGMIGVILDRVNLNLGFSYMGSYLGGDVIIGVGFVF